jgi:hypothetical protein
MTENIIKKILKEELGFGMKLLEPVKVTKSLQYHLDKSIPLHENIYRIYSREYFNLINEVRELYNDGLIKLNENDKWLIETNLGEFGYLDNGNKVWLDVPFELPENLTEAIHRGKKVKLNSPFRTPGGPKKFAVYVKTPKGTIKKVTFGDPKLRIKNSSKKRAKSFRARHKCDQKKDRTKAGYWSCNVGRYAKKLGLKSSKSW